MGIKKIKIAIVFNEPHPELYIKPDELSEKKPDFVPYFEVDSITPIEEYEIMAKRLKDSGVNAYTLNIKDNVEIILKDIKKNKPDLIFNFIEIYKEDARHEMNIVGVLELLRIPFTGAPSMSLANCQSKIFTKRLLNAFGIKTPRFILLKKLPKNYRHRLKYPLIVKPAFEDASVGIENESIVENVEKLKERTEYILKAFAQPALIEEFIEGRELNVAIIGDQDPTPLPISEIDFTEMPDHLHNIVSYQAKWDPNHESYHKTIPICPAKLPKRTEKKAKDIALKAFRAMGCRDYARIDMRLSKDNHLYVLEVNPNPDLTEGAGFMRSAEASGLNYVQTLRKIIDLALLRKNSNPLIR
ncbi:MAG TPA: ATP-grasp domain-containing protein [Ignavibacteriaceae bacterium]|nr:ATP-grasp domain-containing protein [Ignavibacteriaceae bacterium]